MKVEKNISTITGLILAVMIFLAFGNAVSAFNVGNTVEVQNTGDIGLNVRDSPAGNPTGWRKSDGNVGVILEGPQTAALGGITYTWWEIRWSDGLEGWSAEGYGGVYYLKGKYVTPSTKFKIGDTVNVIATTLFVRTNPPELAYKGSVNDGTKGIITDGPFYGTLKGISGFWHFWKVDYGSIVGWSAENWLEKVETVPSPPTPTSPGSTSSPGPIIATLTPTLQWNGVSNADYYAIAISKYPYGSGNVVYNLQQVYGTSITVPNGKLVYGEKYRWNMQAYNSAGWSDISNALYFQTASQNRPPNRPNNIEPSDGATGVSLAPILRASAFSDPDAGDTHWKTWWDVRRCDNNALVWDSNWRTFDLTSTTVPSGKLDYNTCYKWRVRYMDNHGDWSEPLPVTTTFTTKSIQETGSIIVITNLDQATFTITGPQIYSGSAKSWSVSDAPTGTYTIIYGDVSGYITPSSETKTLSAGDSITFSGKYVKSGLYELPATSGKISYFASDDGHPGVCDPVAWGELLGERCGTDDATKYGYVAMRWPYSDPDTDFSDLNAKVWWHNKKILVTNSNNGKQIVLAAKDWGPAKWTGRVIDVSKTALDALGAVTDDTVNIEFADQNAPLGVVSSGTSYPGAQWIPAHPNGFTKSNRESTDITYIVIHTAEGSYQGTIDWFKNPAAGVSANYIISKTGDITAMVRDEDIAYHAGNWEYNKHSIGIELEGFVGDPNAYTEAMYQASANLVNWLAQKYNIQVVHPFGIAPASTTISTGIIGHNQVPDPNDPTKGGGIGHHTDPGPYWDWSYYMDLVSPTTTTIPPAATTDLTISETTANSITLTWTAPGDNGNTGTASQYDIRYSTSPITEDNWDSAAQAAGEPAPQPAGSSESFIVTGLTLWDYILLRSKDW